MAQPILIEWPFNEEADSTLVTHTIDGQPAGSYQLAGSDTSQVVDLAENCQVNIVSVFQFKEAVMIAKRSQTFQIGENCSLPVEIGEQVIVPIGG